MDQRFETRASLLLAAIGLVNVALALFFLPQTPGLDEPMLHSVVYAEEHYGRLFYPARGLPFMYSAPPTKFWLVSQLVGFGFSIRIATAGLFLAAYLVAILGVFACRLTPFQRLGALVAIPAAATLHPFLAFAPENLTFAETIGRLRPDDLVFMLWLAGLLWLEASRRSGWRLAYGFAGGLCLGLAAATHWHGVPGLGAAAVYLAAALRDPGPRARRVAVLALGIALAVVPCAVALWPYREPLYRELSTQGGDTTSRALVDVWRRHVADFWFLQQWLARHFESVWAPAALLAVPARLGVPPLVLAGAMLLARRSTRLLGLAGLMLPLAVLRASRKSAGYELPEIALFLLACGWLLAALLDRAGRRTRIAAAVALAVALATSSPLAWRASALTFMDESHSARLLRAMGRAVVGPGAAGVGPFYAPGEDDHVLDATPLDPGIDFVAEREFHLASAPLHRLYKAGRVRLAGFVLTPEAPSASVVYFSAGQTPLSGFVAREGKLQRFATSGTGWSFEVLECRAGSDELAWVSPQTRVAISGYVPRTDHCVNRVLDASGFAGRFASVFLRRTWSFSSMADQVLVPLLIDDRAAAASAQSLERECGCAHLESTPGGLEPVPAHWLLANLERTERTIRFYAMARDLVAGRDLASERTREAR